MQISSRNFNPFVVIFSKGSVSNPSTKLPLICMQLFGYFWSLKELGAAEKELVSNGSADEAGPGTRGDLMFLGSPSPAISLGQYIGRIGLRMFWTAGKRRAPPSGVAAAQAKQAKVTPEAIRDDGTRQFAAAIAAVSRVEAFNERKFDNDLATAKQESISEPGITRAKRAKVRSSRFTHLRTILMDYTVYSLGQLKCRQDSYILSVPLQH